MVQWTKLTSDSAADLANQAELDAGARSLLTADMRPEAFVHGLIAERMWNAAIAFMARALPVREAVGWACLCDRSTMGGHEDPRHEALLAAGERYVSDPSDENRRAALELAQREPDQSSGQMLAMAAGFSGGAIQVGDNPPIPIPAEAVPPMVAGAVLIAATRVEPAEIEYTYQLFLQRAGDIAAGGSGRLSTDSAAPGEI